MYGYIAESGTKGARYGASDLFYLTRGPMGNTWKNMTPLFAFEIKLYDLRQMKSPTIIWPVEH